MDRTFIIIDNFLDDPDRVRLDALSLDFNRIKESVPGNRSSSALVGDHQTEVETKLKTIFGGEIVWDWTQDSFYFQSCQEGTETWIHKDSPEKDQGEFAAVLYLTPNPNHDAGTAVFCPPDGDPELTDDGYKTNPYPDQEPIMDMASGNVYNRLVIYRGKALYHRSILPGFGKTLETSRLTQVFWFDVK